MILVRSGSGFTGTVTPSRIALNDDGELLRADSVEDNATAPIADAKLEGSELEITVGDGFAFTGDPGGRHTCLHPSCNAAKHEADIG